MAARFRRRLDDLRRRRQPPKAAPVKASIAVAQFPITWDIERNLSAIATILTETMPDEIVVIPEGALSGYGSDLSVLDHLDLAALGYAIDHLTDLARQRAIHLFCGSLLFEHGAWWNTALYFSPHGTRWTYRKINLAMNERSRLAAGGELTPLRLELADGPLIVGVQICREIRFPEQWQHLADAGAQAFIYLTNAANPIEPPGVWQSHLISRAAENQRFVLAANIADPNQHCPTTIISPRGQTLAELPPNQTGLLKTTIDPDDASTWYLGQRRRDIIHLRYQGRTTRQAFGEF
ncbi:carbon-nitrogen hydrolase family protein [Actinomadura latina]|uniref:Carbon-nitrogen hydrolase family protein n=1 Tax=Actinomadura latina TaxID=163603 RepID=A0A846YXS5_9ACTN|nr:carbon-nitrogen hydrolase family protein [Actinomadura latina]NKZ03288.1 carbon-nitrogen hydrolase family protein [Actinomadura latina]